ncbi:hypothetical protein N7499_008231 [Penicillium canescens]|nr:hypothetical protein N7522_012681 [Penicillium canescens]KAJ6076250.1 hypothetical protein N7499_008231 [Penicillium canescens]KAJ6158562.1 hypothetical protein N7485_011388 [Penicillium canescens]
MTATLPPELLFQIATLLQNDGNSLVPCTCVRRSWQAAFEPLLYSNLAVYSDDEHKAEGQRGISLQNFQNLISGDHAIRKTYIRKLEYNILVPYEVLDWMARKHRKNPENYSTDNPIRKDNDLAFQTAIVSLFQELQSWDQNSRLRLNLTIRGRRQGLAPEPHTQHSEIAADYRWDYRDGRILSIPPYRARFLKDMSDLPSLPCIEKLSFLNRNQIWTGAMRTIIQRCTQIVELELDLEEFVRPDHLEYIQARREALSSLVGSIPKSLRVLLYQGHDDAPWKPAMCPLNVIPSGVDNVSSNLRDLSIHLKHLKLVNTTIAYDFLCPLDKKGQPKPGSLQLNWPYLEVLELEGIPPWLPSGEPTYHNTPEDQSEINEIEDWEDVICDVEAGWGWPELPTEEHFHRLLISLGYAAQRMPHLKNVKIEVESHRQFTFCLQNKADQIILKWECFHPYRPDSRVAKAWDFDLEDVKSHPQYEDETSVILRTWPPNNPI